MPTVHPAHAGGKRCFHCKEFKLAKAFSQRGCKYCYLKSRCNACLNANSLATYHADPDGKRKSRERAASAYQRNPEKFRERSREWRAKNPGKYREAARHAEAKSKPARAAYRKANADRIKARHAEYRKREAANIKASSAAYNRANRDAIKARVQKCVAAKPDLYQQLHKAAKHRRKVRLMNSGPVEKFSDREIFWRDGWVCQLCGVPVDPTLSHPDPFSASLDHKLPIAKGGGHTRANVQLAHLRCNLSKRDRPV